MPPRARNHSDLVRAGVEALLQHADPRVVNLHAFNRLRLGEAMPQLRGEIDYHARRRRDARLASPAAVRAARALLEDPGGIIASTAKLHRHIVARIQAIGVLASRKAGDARNRNIYFKETVEAFLRDFRNLPRDKGKVDGIWWGLYDDYQGGMMFTPEKEGNVEEKFIPNDPVHLLNQWITHPGSQNGLKLWSLRVKVTNTAVKLRVMIASSPKSLHNQGYDRPHWLADIKTRISSDGSVTRDAEVEACDYLYRVRNRNANPNRTAFRQNAPARDMCMTGAMAGIRLFGPAYRVTFTVGGSELSWNMRGLQNAMMK